MRNIFFPSSCDCQLSKERPATASEKYSTLHLQLSVMMCRMDFWSSKHHTTRMRTRRLVLSPARWPCLTLLFVRSVHTQLPSPLLSLRPAVPFLPQARVGDHKRERPGGSSSHLWPVSSVSFALIQKQWVMCLRHKCWRVCAVTVCCREADVYFEN